MNNLEDKQKKWLRPGRAAICAQIPEDLADKVIVTARDNAVSRSTVIIDAIEQYFNEDDKKPKIVEKEVIKEIERPKTETEIDLKDLSVEHLAAVIELSKKMNVNYLQTIETICRYIIKREGKAEENYVEIAKKIKKEI